MTARGTWKAYERRVAEALGGRRIPVTGIDRDGADVVTPMFHVQVKLRRMLPSWLWAWLSGIVGTASVNGKIGIMVLKKPGQQDNDALVVLRFSDWRALHGDDGRQA